ncbi:MAG: CPBP family intramembrane glutamic endopeptidase [Candidatus Thiodiazotropha sp.]
MTRQFPIKGRYIIFFWLLPFLYLPGIDSLFGLFPQDVDWYWYELLYMTYAQLLFGGVMAGLIVYYKIDWRLMFSKPDRSEYPPAIKLTAFVFIFSIATAYALFYPLSFTYPEFVELWYIDIPPIIYHLQQSYPIAPNLVSLISLVIFAPVFEEIAFRGILLHSWSEKWGVNRAILISSLLFGIVHPDPIGATAFGIAMSVLYLRTQTLLIPIICHALNNLVVWLYEVGYTIVEGPVEYTLEEFQSSWLIGVACAVITFAWAYLYIGGEKHYRSWSLPKITSRDH